MSKPFTPRQLFIMGVALRYVQANLDDVLESFSDPIGEGQEGKDALPNSISVPWIGGKEIPIFFSILLFGPATYAECYEWMHKNCESLPPIPMAESEDCPQCGICKPVGIRCATCGAESIS